MKNFILKSFVITFCLCITIFFTSFMFPRYHFFNDKHRANLVTGKVQYYTNWTVGTTGWHSMPEYPGID